MKNKKLGVVIPTLNEEDHIGFILNDLRKQTKKASEILVIDGHSSDKTKEIVAKYKNVKFVSSKRGVGLQRHLGAQKLKSDILLFLDADTRIKKNCIEKTLFYFNKYDIDIACAYYLPLSKNIIIWIVYLFFNLIFFIFQKISPSGAGAFIAVKKSHYQKVGGFETKYTYDDIQFIRKAAKEGKFMIMPFYVLVSDRRFRKDGIIKTTVLYLYLSLFFLLGAFDKANKIKYKFGHYKKATKNYNPNS